LDDDHDAIRAYAEEVLQWEMGGKRCRRGGRTLTKKAAAAVTVHVRLDPPAAWIVAASVVASALATMIVLTLAPSVTDATLCLPQIAGGTSPSLLAYKVCTAKVLGWALTILSFLLSVVSLCSIGRSMLQGHECKHHAAPNVQININGISAGGGGGGGGGGSYKTW
jgi:hypothetical protein